MKNLFVAISLFTLFLSCSIAQDKTTLTQAECLKFFKSIKKPDGKKQLEMYTTVEKCSSFYEKDQDLLKTLVVAYSELFKVNRSHNHLEPLMPYYAKNTKSFQALVKSLLDKNSSAEFLERLETAIREFQEGNG